MDAVHVAGAALLVALYMHASSEVTANTTQDLADVKNRMLDEYVLRQYVH